jgi:hypothetical protein
MKNLGGFSMNKILVIALVEDYSSEYETQISLQIDSGTDSAMSVKVT